MEELIDSKCKVIQFGNEIQCIFCPPKCPAGKNNFYFEASICLKPKSLQRNITDQELQTFLKQKLGEVSQVNP